MSTSCQPTGIVCMFRERYHGDRVLALWLLLTFRWLGPISLQQPDTVSGRSSISYNIQSDYAHILQSSPTLKGGAERLSCSRTVRMTWHPGALKTPARSIVMASVNIQSCKAIWVKECSHTPSFHPELHTTLSPSHTTLSCSGGTPPLVLVTRCDQ